MSSAEFSLLASQLLTCTTRDQMVALVPDLLAYRHGRERRALNELWVKHWWITLGLPLSDIPKDLWPATTST